MSTGQPQKRVRESSTQSDLTDPFIDIGEFTEVVDGLKQKMDSMMTKDDLQIMLKDIVGVIYNQVKDSISAEIETTEVSTNEAHEKIEKQEDSINIIENKNQKLQSKLDSVTQELNALKATSNQAICMANYNEQYSRKTNIKILNLTQTDNTNLQATVIKVISQVTGKTISNNDLVAVHHLPSKFQDKPKPVLVKFRNSDIKRSIMINRSKFFDRNIKVFDDITRHNSQLINRVKRIPSVESAWYYNGSVYAKLQGRRGAKINLFESTEDITKRLQQTPTETKPNQFK
ncbi:hypothetical protein SNE40_014319 [Patella caerulea]|uniref:Uncharacterized protein n=1 Tax=Patella caerulea TaxID=87958 RepID=A0AAN8PQA3_PATCE